MAGRLICELIFESTPNAGTERIFDRLDQHCRILQLHSYCIVIRFLALLLQTYLHKNISYLINECIIILMSCLWETGISGPMGVLPGTHSCFVHMALTVGY